jgi:hypothetical protein
MSRAAAHLRGRVTRRVHKPIMSSAATTSKPEDEIKPTEAPKEGDEIPHLSVLEEDDEFEEFPVQGEHPPCHDPYSVHYAGTPSCF